MGAFAEAPVTARRKRRRAQPKSGTPHGVRDDSAPLPTVLAARTPAEAAVVAAYEAAILDRTQRSPTMRIQEPDGGLAPFTDDVELWWARIAAAFGVRDVEAQVHLINQVGSVFWKGAADTNANAAIALIREIAPRNGVEALLAAQMVAVHNVALEQLRRALVPEQPAQFIDSLTNRGTQLLRLYVDQVAALERLRGGGTRQTVRVERVTVEAGGQAVVGAVAALPAAPQVPVADPQGEGMGG